MAHEGENEGRREPEGLKDGGGGVTRCISANQAVAADEMYIRGDVAL
jgi:hypothetical protein